MSIQIPTSEVNSPLDVAALAQLAGDFFAALPGETPASHPLASSPLQTAQGGVAAPVNVLPAGTSLGPIANGPQLPGTIAPGANAIPQSPQSVLNLGASTPSLLAHSAAPNGLPDQTAIVPPALDGRLGGASLGVPQASAPSATDGVDAHPRTGISAAQTQSSPFYFLSETAGYPTSVQNFEVSREDRVNAQSFGLPGEQDLKSLLSDNPRAKVQPNTGNLPASQSTLSHSDFYYAPADRQPHGFATRVPQLDATPRYGLDVNAVRQDFPILHERVNGKQLVWFDNAATTHKPKSVIERIAYFYEHENSNIHRAAHELAARATDAYEGAREKVRAFIGAESVNEVIFVRGTTEAINLVAKTWGAQNVGEGDEIIVSNLEHHANIVPWQQLAAAKGAKLKVIPVDDSGQVLLEEYKKLLNDRTKIVSVTQVSNALGTVVPVKEIVTLAHAAGAKALVDGAQSVSHMRVNVQNIGADFFVFSGHKVFGPTGIGVVYGRKDLLESMPPWQGGGNMIADVTFDRTIFQPAPNKFEAGTGNIADAVGLGAAIDYVQRIGLDNIARYEHDLLAYATHHLQPIKGVRLVGTAQDKASVLSFVLRGYSTEEVGKALNKEGIAVRTGHHCAQPILRRFGLETTVRPSLAFYNTCEEVDRMIAVVRSLSQSRH
jgi:cysteine desulfurase / selenocysteine lyase